MPEPYRIDCWGEPAITQGERVPFFFDLSSLTPLVERNPFEPPLVRDEIRVTDVDSNQPVATEPVADFGLPIPTHYDFDMMRTMVQDPFRLYVYWNLRGNPWDRVERIFPAHEVSNFRLSLRLVDESSNITVFFDVPYTREYWFNVFPDRTYRVELGLRSPQYGYIKLLSTQSVTTPRGGPSDQVATEPEYQIDADNYLQVLRESHLIPERAWVPNGVLPATTEASAMAASEVWERLPLTFRQVLKVIGDIQAGREYDKWWEKLGQEELAGLVREFLDLIREMGEGELGYLLLMRYLPELLRRAIRAEGGEEVRVDKPVAIFLAERLGQTSSAMKSGSHNESDQNENARLVPPGSASGSLPTGIWAPNPIRN